LYHGGVLSYCQRRIVTFLLSFSSPAARMVCDRLPSAAKSRIVLDQGAACVPTNLFGLHYCW
jgi:hypothetical protein